MTAQIKNNGGSQLDFVLGGIVVATVDETGIKKGVSVAPSLNGVPLFHHNEIVNGDFRIAQIGTSFAAPVDGAYDLDGWNNGKSSAAVFTVAQVAGSTAGRLARQVTITTADTVVAAGDLVLDITKIEGSNIEKYVGNTFTVAFRAKVPVAGIHCVALRNSAANRSYVKEINFPTANTWQDCSFTVAGGLPTAGTWNYTNGIGLEIDFSHMCGTTYQTTPDAWNTGNFLGTANQVNDCATVGNVWALEKVTMNLGTVAAVSEISYEQELSRCHRYARPLPNRFVAQALSASAAAGTTYGQPMRATPILSTTAGWSMLNASSTYNAATNPGSAIIADASGAVFIEVQGGSGLAGGNATLIRTPDGGLLLARL